MPHSTLWLSLRRIMGFFMLLLLECCTSLPTAAQLTTIAFFSFTELPDMSQPVVAIGVQLPGLSNLNPAAHSATSHSASGPRLTASNT